MMRARILCILLSIHTFGAFAQNKSELRIAGDCHDAVPITLVKPSQYGPTQSPHLFGAKQEITSTDRNSEVSFAQEHNSAWYLLSIKYDGELTFEIVPTDSTNDYDFLLYPYRDSTFCDQLMARRISPIRSNIAANVHALDHGATGLSQTARQDFHRQGVGDQFSRSLAVKKGEKYMLVLDNVTPNGRGHTIFFHTLISAAIKGQVLGGDSLPIVADVQLSDPKGQTVAQTRTDASGKYDFKATIERNTSYSLTFSNDSSFIGTKIINTSNTKDGHTFPEIKTVLPKLKKGGKYTLGNINFYGNVAILLPESYPSVEALAKLMKKNKHMRIMIEGHVNGAGATEAEKRSTEYQELSENRAKTVRLCLLNAGIAADRMQTIGYAATQMLFPKAVDEDEQKANRRVEIRVISIE